MVEVDLIDSSTVSAWCCKSNCLDGRYSLKIMKI